MDIKTGRQCNSCVRVTATCALHGGNLSRISGDDRIYWYVCCCCCCCMYLPRDMVWTEWVLEFGGAVHDLRMWADGSVSRNSRSGGRIERGQRSGWLKRPTRSAQNGHGVWRKKSERFSYKFVNNNNNGVCCKRSAGRTIRHNTLNDMLCRVGVRSGVPSSREPIGIFRSDGKRPDGMTLVPWKVVRCLDVTCPDTLAASHRALISGTPGAAAERVSSTLSTPPSKQLTNLFQLPLKPWVLSTSRHVLLMRNRRTYQKCSRWPRETAFLFQSVSVIVQRANAIILSFWMAACVKKFCEFLNSLQGAGLTWFAINLFRSSLLTRTVSSIWPASGTDLRWGSCNRWTSGRNSPSGSSVFHCFQSSALFTSYRQTRRWEVSESLNFLFYLFICLFVCPMCPTTEACLQIIMLTIIEFVTLHHRWCYKIYPNLSSSPN